MNMTTQWNERPAFIQQASIETGNWDAEEFICSFLERWGDYTPDTLKRAVHEGEGDDKLFAIIALGLLESSEGDALLIPYLQSENRRERWASTLALGRHKDDRAFSLLQDLLVEGIFDVNLDEYEWMLAQRCEIALTLGAWGSPQATSALRQAFRLCWEIEQQPDPSGRRWDSFEREYWWHYLQDHLAYALGQLGAWGAMCSLGLPAAHLRITTIYMTLGALQVNSPKLWDPVLAPLIFRKSSYSSYRLALFSSDPHAPLLLDPVPVSRVLNERFGLSETEQVEYIQGFWQDWDSGRKDEDTSMMSKVEKTKN
jgi:HEAT repeats